MRAYGRCKKSGTLLEKPASNRHPSYIACAHTFGTLPCGSILHLLLVAPYSFTLGSMMLIAGLCRPPQLAFDVAGRR